MIRTDPRLWPQLVRLLHSVRVRLSRLAITDATIDLGAFSLVDKQLKRLSFVRCKFKDVALKNRASLGVLVNLQSLAFDFCEDVTDRLMSAIAASLGTELQKLYLSICGPGPSLSCIDCANLRYFSVHNEQKCRLDLQGSRHNSRDSRSNSQDFRPDLQAVLRIVERNMESLEGLSLCGIIMDNLQYTTFWSQFGNMKFPNLKYLDLSSNCLESGVDIKRSCPNLVGLDLWSPYNVPLPGHAEIPMRRINSPTWDFDSKYGDTLAIKKIGRSGKLHCLWYQSSQPRNL
ncbi:hypothetical protein PSACC_00989 [Paramicrosporidium saccamoebae]|uniref:Uncharacterized protein n=1 Tax=Paramicrosporidium saccamoebae TaxID=1246581 RepID=A0A2H9TN51_9FUNG|nr:hypothetical protein PSACC_00989 [Paramicrosporidium saccamoebae]